MPDRQKLYQNCVIFGNARQPFGRQGGAKMGRIAVPTHEKRSPKFRTPAAVMSRLARARNRDWRGFSVLSEKGRGLRVVAKSDIFGSCAALPRAVRSPAKPWRGAGLARTLETPAQNGGTDSNAVVGGFEQSRADRHNHRRSILSTDRRPFGTAFWARNREKRRIFRGPFATLLANHRVVTRARPVAL